MWHSWCYIPERPNGKQLDQRGHPHSGASVFNQHPGSTPGSSHSTGGSRAADRTASGYSQAKIQKEILSAMVSEIVAAVGTFLTHAAIGVIAVLFAEQQ